MTAKKIKIKHEDKSSSKDFLKKAEDNYLQMLDALKAENYNAAGRISYNMKDEISTNLKLTKSPKLPPDFIGGLPPI